MHKYESLKMAERQAMWSDSVGGGDVNKTTHPSTDIDTSSISFPKDELRGESQDDNTSNASMTDVDNSMESSDHFIGLDDDTIMQAVVYIEDAYKYRTIDHKVGPKHLQIYRKYQSWPVIVFRFIVIFLLHMLAFIEHPSSLTLTSDLRTRGTRTSVPCWVTQCLEFICLFLLLADNCLKFYLAGRYYFLRQKWNMAALFIVSISFIDWTVSFGMLCHEPVRFRRLLRPFFIFQNSSLMKKIVRCLKRTLPEVISVLLLLALHIIVFTMFAMLLFPVYEIKEYNITQPSTFNGSASTASPPPADEGTRYFYSLLESLLSLLVLLTTANHPDVTLPAYSRNRLASIFFILYLLIGLYFLMNMLLAIIYNQFRGYFLNSMQSSLIRRRLGVRAAFEVLRRKQFPSLVGFRVSQNSLSIGIGGMVIKTLVDKSLLPQHVKDSIIEKLKDKENHIFSPSQFQNIFYSMDENVVHKQLPAVRWFNQRKWRVLQHIFIHRFFTYFGMLMAFINLIIITIQLGAKYDSSFRENHSTLRIVNFSFVMYYTLEQAVKIWAFGWRRYISDKGNIFDAVITIALVIGETVSAIMYGIPYFPSSKELSAGSSSTTMWNILRMVNILIMVRMFKVIPHVNSMSLVVTVLIDMLRNMMAFAGILIAIFYVFAIFGMQLYEGVIKYEPDFVNKTFPCGTYEQLNYWANNFDDFFSSIIILWDVMVVNNWMIFLQVFRDRTSPWSYLYFVAWWLISVIIVLNLFTALIMENFIMKWDRRRRVMQTEVDGLYTYEHLTVSVQLNSFHNMFKGLLEEPSESELLLLLDKHKYLDRSSL
ncbi:two pore channel protein 2-like [Physella acuta]|uniref:two pore channel protein 2-like n=1 Tax=Physella acuta TaxID=109671 RepID=UPI0027DCCD72|nr:two pore channel protein 2-like [Physella acuta]